jgi:Tetracyclin repressor-like, C-terminal domain
VVAPAEQRATPLEKIQVLCEQFASHVERLGFPDGCFFASAAAELDTHPGAVRGRVSEFQHS